MKPDNVAFYLLQIVGFDRWITQFFVLFCFVYVLLLNCDHRICVHDNSMIISILIFDFWSKSEQLFKKKNLVRIHTDEGAWKCKCYFRIDFSPLWHSSVDFCQLHHFLFRNGFLTRKFHCSEGKKWRSFSTDTQWVKRLALDSFSSIIFTYYSTAYNFTACL